MTSGRTVWQAQDAGWWRRERVVLLGEHFGSEGPAVANLLECEAKAQNAGGFVKAGYATTARGAFLAGGADRAREIVAFAVKVGFLDDFAEGEFTFTARVSAFGSDQGRGYDALRKQAKRSDQEPPDTTGQDRTDRDRPPELGPYPHTGQERTEETPLSSELDVVASPQPHSGTARAEKGHKPTRPTRDERPLVARQLFEYWQEKCRYPRAKFGPERRAKVLARLREGYTPEQIRQAIDGAARAAFVNDQGKRFDDLELICRNGSKLEDFMDRAGQHANGIGDSDRLAAALNARNDSR